MKKQESKAIKLFRGKLNAQTKKILFSVGMVAVIAVAVLVNWVLSLSPHEDSIGVDKKTGDKVLGDSQMVNGTENVDSVNSDENFFAIQKIERQRARDEEIEVLQNVVDTAEMVETKDKALNDMATIAGQITAEANVETLIKAKGFEDCVAVISGDVMNIIIHTSGLLPNEVGQIKEIVYEQAGIKPGNVKIIERAQN